MRPTFPKIFGSVLLACSALALGMGQAQAHGGGGHRGGYHHHHGGGRAWVAPALIGGALLGAAFATHSYSYAYPVAAPMPVYPVVPSYVAPVAPAPAAPTNLPNLPPRAHGHIIRGLYVRRGIQHF